MRKIINNPTKKKPRSVKNNKIMPLKTPSNCIFRKINLCGDGLHIFEQHLFKTQRHKSTLYLSNDLMQHYCIILLISKLCATDLMMYSNSTLTSSLIHCLRVYQTNHTKFPGFLFSFFTLVKKKWTVLPARKRQHTKPTKPGAFGATD